MRVTVMIALPGNAERTFVFAADASIVVDKQSGQSMLTGEILSLLRRLARVWDVSANCDVECWVPGDKAVIRVNDTRDRRPEFAVAELERIQKDFPVEDTSRKVVAAA